MLRLPEELARRFEVVAELPVQGAESDLLLVRDARGEFVVKLFRRGYHADREVWAKLPVLDTPHVVRILETGQAEGRDYEVSEYAPDGNLRALMGGPLPEAAIRKVVEQLAGGVRALHGVGIVHRDLKPENVLVLGADPLRLAIADFGLSKVLDQSMVFASSSRTLAYAAPESLSGQVSPARDWWSLGMIVRELVTGRAPFLGLSETAVVDHLATRAVPADDVDDPRLRLLCRGLLVRDPRKRWGGEQVALWLRGEVPEVVDETPQGVGVPFDGRRYDERGELARALVGKWDFAASYFFGRGEAGEAWRSLREWLNGLPDDSRIGLIDGYLTTDLPPDVKLLHLVRWLDPGLPPHYLGWRLAAEDLPRLAQAAGDPLHSDHRMACLVGQELWDRHLLRVLAGFEGGRELASIDDRWRAHVGAWNELAGWLRSQTPSTRLNDDSAVLLTLLALAARPGEMQERIAAAAGRARASVPEPVAWFDWMADGAGDDPLRLLAVARAAPEAALEVEARVRERRAAEQRSGELKGRWAERERLRLAGQKAAMGRAVAWSLPLVLPWLLGSWVLGVVLGGEDEDGIVSQGGFQGSSGVPFGALVVFSLLAWAVQCGSEVMLARAQGRDYLQYGPWSSLSRFLGAGGRGLAKASQTMSGAAQRTGRRGCGLLLLAGTVPLLLILLLMGAISPFATPLWVLVMVAGAAAHAVAAGMRLHRWRQTHGDAERKALS
ncbi:serine/threonine-protein kinase [Actinomadura sp. 9N407]|uniref:serine/threonine-protein kinase n=1 Tax=Actinomadura sp. 9N407 TaxID=3375154 RepID=UPI003799CF40